MRNRSQVSKFQAHCIIYLCINVFYCKTIFIIKMLDSIRLPTFEILSKPTHQWTIYGPDLPLLGCTAYSIFRSLHLALLCSTPLSPARPLLCLLLQPRPEERSSGAGDLRPSPAMPGSSPSRAFRRFEVIFLALSQHLHMSSPAGRRNPS
jgi:hypothetical protein